MNIDHQVANANVAGKIGITKRKNTIKTNGDVVQFQDGKLVDNFEHINVDEIMIDGTSSEDIGELVLKDREMLSDNGIVIVCATLDKKTKKSISRSSYTYKRICLCKRQCRSYQRDRKNIIRKNNWKYK